MEIWKDVVGFEQHYEVSSYGNVRRKGKTKHLAKITDKDGYVVHCFCVNTVRKNVMAHQLVAEAFMAHVPMERLLDTVMAVSRTTFLPTWNTEVMLTTLPIWSNTVNKQKEKIFT